ncbi:DUF6263 family protein [Polaribacter aestuariivivens]|uniref:DUF6263 family protein n=1 Tax=Polaribacter aestuariivivens TaxID=2304626 RepID=UPI003F492636
MKKLLVLFIVATGLNINAQESVFLKLNYKKGDTFLVQQDVSQNMGAQGGLDMKMKMEMIVTKREKDTFHIKSKIKHIDMNMLQGGQVMTYDSSIKEEDLDPVGKMVKQQFDPMLSAAIFSKVTRNGEVISTKVEPLTPALEQFTKQNKGVNYPKDKVSVGSTWSDEVNEQGMSLKTIYTVAKIENGKVYIDVSGNVSGVDKGSINGNLIIDTKSGVQDSSNMTIFMSSNGMDIEIKTKSKMTKI